MKRLNARGYTFVEVMVALGLLTLISYLISEGIDQMRGISDDTLTLSANERQITTIADNIRTGLDSYQINFDHSDAAREAALDVKKLPMAWDVGVSAPVAECSVCKGRYGYTVQMLEQYRGLYLVTLRIKHETWREPYRDYQFVVTAK